MPDAIVRSLMALAGVSLLVLVPLMAAYSSAAVPPSRLTDGFSVAASFIGIAIVLLCAVAGAACIYGAIFALPVVMR